MKVRIDYRTVFPAAVNSISALEAAVLASSLEPQLLELVKVRASQVDCCACCVDMHTKVPHSISVDDQRPHLVAVWSYAPRY